MLEWLQEKRTIRPLSNGNIRKLYIDNCSSHVLNADVLDAAERIPTILQYFPANATDLVQPCDSFVIQKLKDARGKRWDAYKLGLIKSKALTEAGKLPNPGKLYFLRMEANSINDVNRQRDENGLTYARRSNDYLWVGTEH